MRLLPIPINEPQLKALCQHHGIAELSLFGSILRDDFSPKSDIDVLIALLPGKTMTLEAHMEIREKLSELFESRHIDLLRREYLKNPYRKAEIMRTREILYAE